MLWISVSYSVHFLSVIMYQDTPRNILGSLSNMDRKSN